MELFDWVTKLGFPVAVATFLIVYLTRNLTKSIDELKESNEKSTEAINKSLTQMRDEIVSLTFICRLLAEREHIIPTAFDKDWPNYPLQDSTIPAETK